MALQDDLLLQILRQVGAPALARLATLHSRLRHAQSQLAGLPAFSSAARIEEQADAET